MPTHLEVADELVARLKKGEEAAFKIIYDLLHARIYRMVLSLVKDAAKTDEVLQETFVKLWLNREKLTIDQPLYPFVYLTAKRLAIDHFRKALQESDMLAYLTNQSKRYTNDTEEAVFLADLTRLTDESIKALPVQQQAVFILSRHEGLSYDEIAQRLHISPNTVRNHMVCALRTLRHHFTKHGVIYGLLLAWPFI
ncbi:RNA polymerase sigma factor [Parapedobacter sp. 10938]|uniref:RNA polymerase sigma factor n=1 Tax=Parapedobacter flavus TaxID=3110225 RepID=UPI002DB875A0|nr:sigma-70 family RNA polymerase sigma factor [Parapedobacter sp. 10938]MEC3880687.1 sigma-70 family RNA polymerase sigma factor [Parapedobacter sp. 10938]